MPKYLRRTQPTLTPFGSLTKRRDTPVSTKKTPSLGVPYDLAVNLDRLHAVLQAGLHGLRAFGVEQAGEVGLPVGADGLHFDRTRLVDQHFHGRRADRRADGGRLSRG